MMGRFHIRPSENAPFANLPQPEQDFQAQTNQDEPQSITAFIPSVLLEQQIIYIDRETIREVPVEVEKIVTMTEYVDRTIEIPVEVVKEVFIDRVVEVFKEVPIKVEVIQYIDRIVPNFKLSEGAKIVMVVEAILIVLLFCK